MFPMLYKTLGQQMPNMATHYCSEFYESVLSMSKLVINTLVSLYEWIKRKCTKSPIQPLLVPTATDGPMIIVCSFLNTKDAQTARLVNHSFNCAILRERASYDMFIPQAHSDSSYRGLSKLLMYGGIDVLKIAFAFAGESLELFLVNISDKSKLYRAAVYNSLMTLKEERISHLKAAQEALIALPTGGTLLRRLEFQQKQLEAAQGITRFVRSLLIANAYEWRQALQWAPPRLLPSDFQYGSLEVFHFSDLCAPKTLDNLPIDKVLSLLRIIPLTFLKACHLNYYRYLVEQGRLAEAHCIRKQYEERIQYLDCTPKTKKEYQIRLDQMQ